MQLICETLFPPRMSVTITFLTYSSYTSQSIAVVTTAIFIPDYLFIARQSRHRMSGVTHQNLIFGGGKAESPSNAMWPGPRSACQIKFHLDPSNRLATVHERYRQTGQTTDWKHRANRFTKIARPNFTKFSVHVSCGRGSVLFWRRCNTLCNSWITSWLCVMTWCLPITAPAKATLTGRIHKMTHQGQTRGQSHDVYDCFVSTQRLYDVCHRNKRLADLLFTLTIIKTKIGSENK